MYSIMQQPEKEMTYLIIAKHMAISLNTMFVGVSGVNPNHPNLLRHAENQY